MLTSTFASQVLHQLYQQAAQGYVHGSPEGAYLDAFSQPWSEAVSQPVMRHLRCNNLLCIKQASFCSAEPWQGLSKGPCIRTPCLLHTNAACDIMATQIVAL